MPGIYVHIPFCRSKCRYCDFVSYPDKLSLSLSYVTCVIDEIVKRADELKGYVFDTVYIGGGTPSALDPVHIGLVLGAVKKHFNVIPDAEITIEMNPASADAEKIKLYKTFGVNRFSVGLQSAIDAQLEDMGRNETVADFVACARLLSGENYSVDVMIGLKGQTAENVEETISVATSFGAKHISMYALTPEEGTPIYTDYLNGELPDGDEVREMYDAGYEKLRELGFERYEVSNFAIPGYESRHNMNYWRRGEYIGLGVAASSHIKDERFTNTQDLDEYYKCIMTGHLAEISREKIEGQDKKDEYVMLALRTAHGIDVDEYGSEFGEDFFTEYEKSLQRYGNFLDVTSGNVRIKDEYLYVQNSIIIEFLGL
ncbi:MAG: radical SAM family heme chaperone HemW [Clostridia bacterium]|nr:radical SAM family heme chaperone HemW [Clostridia bacterium]